MRRGRGGDGGGRCVREGEGGGRRMGCRETLEVHGVNTLASGCGATGQRSWWRRAFLREVRVGRVEMINEYTPTDPPLSISQHTWHRGVCG